MKKIFLKPKKDESLKRFHPWVFSGAVEKADPGLQEGDIVEIFDATGNYLATGHCQIGSIAVRVLSFNREKIDISFWKKRLNEARLLRQKLSLAKSGYNNIYRLVHGEGDFLPGLIIDIYGDTAVIQAHSVGMHVAAREISDALSEVMQDEIRNIFYKSDTTLPYKAELNAENIYLKGKSSDNIAVENGLKFKIDWEKGQKTGFFIDQRENRSIFEKYAEGRSVLNMFCYTGSFSVYAVRGNAKLVHSVDSSAKAIDLTDKNIQLNFPGNTVHQSFVEDAFKYLDSINNEYDLIILDPPAFAKHKDSLRNALNGYRKLNAKAFEKIQPGGILFTFSCSQAVDKHQFRLTVFTAAAQSGRKVRILRQLNQPADHPINIYHPEGEYLKGLVLYVE